MSADHDIFKSAHAAEEADVLEGAGDSAAGNPERRKSLQGCALEEDFSLRRGDQSGHTIEESRFSGAVGSDQAVDRPAGEDHVNAVQRRQTAKEPGQSSNLKQPFSPARSHQGRGNFYL